jgi:NodT family efflux transporter outer membrane factor (OMF) lipoprotein
MIELKDMTPDHRLPSSCSPYRMIASIIVLLSMLSGCAVGPDFKRPEAPKTASYTAEALPEKTVSAPLSGGEAQLFTPGQTIPGQWWSLFHSKDLDDVIKRAIADSPSLASAQAALRQAQEYYIAGRGSFFPAVDANVSVVRQKNSGTASRQPNADTRAFTLYNASVGVSYSLDLFGGMRRELESLKSQIDYQTFLLEGTYLALTSNIVTEVVREASLRGQINATKEILDVQEKQLALVGRQFDLGVVSLSDVLAQKAVLAQTRAALPPLVKELDLARNRLSVLSGRLPSDEGLPEFELDKLKLPKDLPVSLPSELVRQRPDIRASEALLHAASADVGVATANLYPDITLTGTYGSKAIGTGDLFSANSAFWSLGAGLLQPIFRGGELSAMRRAAIAAYDFAESNYRETVLLAFQDVADVLRALDADALILKAQADAEAAARESLDLTQEQFRLGSANYLSLLNAQRQYQQARIALVQAKAQRLADTAALFQALGGGWWNRPLEDGTEKKEYKD